jgi:hypothetical protein
LEETAMDIFRFWRLGFLAGPAVVGLTLAFSIFATAALAGPT